MKDLADKAFNRRQLRKARHPVKRRAHPGETWINVHPAREFSPPEQGDRLIE
jgi:hypothetical protein